MIIVIGTAQTTPESAAKALELSRAHCARSRREPGCIDHTVAMDQERPGLLRFVELWRDEAALKAHFAVPASQDFIAAISPLLAHPPRMSIYESAETNIM